MNEEPNATNPENSPSDGTAPPAPQMKGKITFVPATAEDYARGFSFGTTFGTPPDEHPTLRSRMRDPGDRPKDEARGETTKDNIDPGS